MKKQIKKLNLNKTTISNLGVPEMNNYVGGERTNGNKCGPDSGNCSIACSWTACPTYYGTCQGHTCQGNHC